MTRIVVLTAGLRQPSSSRLLADRLAVATTDVLRGRGQTAEVETVELREYARELTNHLLTGFAAGRLAQLIERVTAADALIVVSPIFSGSYSGLFKTFFDVLEPGRAGRQAGADRGDRRHRPALAGAGICSAAAVQLPSHRGRANRCVRGAGGLGIGRAAVRTGRPGRR